MTKRAFLVWWKYGATVHAEDRDEAERMVEEGSPPPAAEFLDGGADGTDCFEGCEECGAPPTVRGLSAAGA